MTRQSSKTDLNTAEWQSATQFRHLMPKGQPDSIHEISRWLYQPFLKSSSRKLRFRLSGCAIDPIPFVQMSSGEYRILTGQAVSPDYIPSMGLDELDEFPEPPPLWNSPTKREQCLQQLDEIRCQEKLAEAADKKFWIIWCNHFHGCIAATAEQTTIEIPFSVWGMRLINGFDQCPPYRCPVTNVETYNLDIDDKGVITDSDQILECPETGRRLCIVDMQRCESSGRLVEPSTLMKCPVSQTTFLTRLAVTCPGCFQLVAPESVRSGHRGQCQTCHSLRRIKSIDFVNDGLLDHLVRNQPWLKSARKVRFATQKDQWLIQCQTNGGVGGKDFFWRILFDRHSGQAIRVNQKSGWLSSWRCIDPGQWPAFLASDPASATDSASA